LDKNNDSFQPLFTDWKEIDLWYKTRENITGWIMTTREIFDFVSKQKSNNGIVINPASDRWTMNAEQIELFVKDNY
jgi:hypothetical protein